MAEIVVLGSEGFSQHWTPLQNLFGDRLVVEPDWRPSTVAAHNPDLVITFEASNAVRGLCIAEMVRQKVATLLIMDGIQEWRNTWSRRDLPHKRPLNQPILTHKVACLGNVDARLYESWGNVGKCEVVGSYRMDKIVALNRPMRIEPVTGRPMRLLVMTARTPGFTPEETEVTFQSLVDLRDALAQREDIEVIWRVTKGLHERLNVKNTFTDVRGTELHEILLEVDAVITTPSTAMLEGMIFGHPVALLDYHRVPHYVQAAWEIGCRDSINFVLDQLKNPPLERMLFQDYCLHDALYCRTPAMPRTIQLIEDMIAFKRQNDRAGTELVFPFRMVNDIESKIAWPSEQFDLQKLYPHHPVFGSTDLTFLQSELDCAIGTVEQLKQQVLTLEDRLHRIPGYLLAKKLSKSLGKVFH